MSCMACIRGSTVYQHRREPKQTKKQYGGQSAQKRNYIARTGSFTHVPNIARTLFPSSERDTTDIESHHVLGIEHRTQHNT